jgi:3-methyladenine DNA glycosylase AlkD
MTAGNIEQAVKRGGSKARAQVSARFFKTGPGEYGAGDTFSGLTVPACRVIAKQHRELKLSEIKKLLRSPIHETRLIGFLILVEQFKLGGKQEHEKIFKFYLANLKRTNNWDLVDLSSPKIAGNYLIDKPKDILFKLAKSKNLWERRVAIVSTYAFIRAGHLTTTFKLAELLKSDHHDLMHKAIGWMLREVGKKDGQKLEKFLREHLASLPRTTLRYAIERFPETKRQKYLNGKIS